MNIQQRLLALYAGVAGLQVGGDVSLTGMSIGQVDDGYRARLTTATLIVHVRYDVCRTSDVVVSDDTATGLSHATERGRYHQNDQATPTAGTERLQNAEVCLPSRCHIIILLSLLLARLHMV